MVKSGFANQTATTDNGSFTLTFQNGKPGYNTVLVLEKEQWVITEKNRLEVNLPLDPFNHPHTIIMCRADVWAKQNQDNFKLLNKILREALQKKKAELNKQSKDFQKITDSLDDQFVRSKRNLYELAETLSRVNLDQVSETEKAAYAYFAQGKIEESILLRETLQSEKNLLLANERLKQLNKNGQDQDSASRLIYNTIDLHRRNLKEEINLSKLRFDWKTAERKLKFLAENDSSDYENELHYGEFLQGQNDFDKAHVILKKALTTYTRLKQANPGAFSSNLARAQYDLGLVLKSKYQYKASEEALKEAYNLYKQLSNSNPVSYSKGACEALIGLSQLYVDKHLYKEAESELRQALATYKSVEQTSPKLYEAGVAEVQNNLGVFYLKRENYKSAETTFKQALELRKNLNETDPLSNEIEIAEIENNLGQLYLNQKKYDGAKVALENALAVYRKFQQTSPTVFDPYVASVLTNLGGLYTARSDLGTYAVEKHDSTAARNYLGKAMEIAKSLATRAPGVYEPVLAETYNQMGVFFREANDRDSAEAFFTETLLIFEKFSKLVPEMFELPLAGVQHRLGQLYPTRNSASARLLFNSALAIYQRWSLTNKENLEEEIASCRYDIAANDYHSRVFYSKQENENSIRKSLSQFQELLETYNSLEAKNPGKYIEDVKSLRNFIGSINNELKRTQAIDPSIYRSKTDKERVEDELNGLVADIESANTTYNKLILHQLLVQKKRDYIKSGKFSDILSYGHDLNGLSWYLLLNRRYAEAEQAAREALTPWFTKTGLYDKEMEYVNANLAVALLLQNKFEEAKKVYLSLKGKSYDDRSYVSMFLDDFAQLEKADITHPDFNKIKGLLVD
ncbi:hypothetical protein SAE01_32900 [Segetibacter aerophilus]|uniref:MalT-like TPR region domain-containing protein n=2 Tax=Segetibacter aerophilus TaxID=670293 RepID=A0A512BFQ4_9BACT|nr:hypothetical protein SAE01_32900 [Segetibacter aerophilus]